MESRREVSGKGTSGRCGCAPPQSGNGRQRFPSRFFFCPAKRCGKRTADAGRNDDAMRLGPAWASKERFSRPERRILHSGRPYMAWNGHGVQPASSVLTFTAGVHACLHLSDLLTNRKDWKRWPNGPGCWNTGTSRGRTAVESTRRTYVLRWESASGRCNPTGSGD